jgi:hypothetical protein
MTNIHTPLAKNGKLSDSYAGCEHYFIILGVNVI